MKNKRLSFGYEDVYQKIEIDLFGLIFEINKEKIENSDIENINENEEDGIKAKIEEIIGEGAIEKINEKAISDGYAKMTLAEEIKVLTFLYTTYMNYTVNGMVEDITTKGKEIEDNAKNLGNENNGIQRRKDYQKRYPRNHYDRRNRNYRRY